MEFSEYTAFSGCGEPSRWSKMFVMEVSHVDDESIYEGTTHYSCGGKTDGWS
jgi:hypothetical protein